MSRHGRYRTLSPLAGARYGERWRVMLTDINDREIKSLTGVRSGSLDFSIHTEIRSSGSLEVDEPSRVDWHRVRLHISYEFHDETGVEHSYPLGIYLPTTPSTSHGDGVSSAEVSLYDKMVMLSTDNARDTWTAKKGTTVVQAVTDVLSTIGETRIAGPDDGGDTLKSSMVWEPGETKLRIINDILEAGNFFSVWVDGEGVWRLDPYTSPASRGIEHEFVEGPGATFLAEISHEADGWDVPNQVMIVGRSDDEGETAPPFAIAENDNPDDPFSVPSRGRVISLREDEQDATSIEVLGRIAARRLIEAASVTSSYEIDHAWRPIELNSAVALVVESRDIDAFTVLQSWSWSWDAASTPGLVSAKLREVGR